MDGYLSLAMLMYRCMAGREYIEEKTEEMKDDDFIGCTIFSVSMVLLGIILMALIIIEIL